MGESQQEPLSLEFDARVRLEFVGSKITSDAGMVAYRELDGKLGLTAMAGQFLRERRTGRNIQHELVPLLRQPVDSRLAGYPDTNDADRLARGAPPGDRRGPVAESATLLRTDVYPQ